MNWMAICRVKGCEWERRERTEARASQLGASHERERPGHKVAVVRDVTAPDLTPQVQFPPLRMPFAWEHMEN
jgi:hypothetical protein